MSNYKQDVTTGWQRSPKVIMTNRYKQVPTILFEEELLVDCDGSAHTIPVGSLEASFLDLLAEPIPLLDEDTDQVLGTVDIMIKKNEFYSIYRYLAAKRDGQQ